MEKIRTLEEIARDSLELDDIEIKPKQGSLVIFPSNDNYTHGVKEVTKLNRYTIAAWYAGHEYYAE